MKTISARRSLTGYLLPFILAGVSSLEAAVIEVANTSGQKMTVEIVSYTASSGNVRIKRADGQFFNTKLSVFDAPSQEKIIANAPKELPDFSLDVSIGRQRARQGNSAYMQNMTITTSVKVENKSRDIDLDQTNCTIVLVGRNAKRYANRAYDWFKVLSVQKFSTTLTAGKSSEHELRAIETTYDQDKDSSNLGGWEFEGYLLVAQDEDGNIIATKTTLGDVSTTTLKDPKAILAAIALSEGMETNHDLTPRGR